MQGALFIALLVAPAIELANGRWELDPEETEEPGRFTCSDTPLMISTKERRYLYQQGESRGEAEILAAEDNYIAIRYLDEDRLDDQGNPVVWVMVYPDDDHFYWQRLDWLQQGQGGRTNLRRRCPDPELLG